LTGAGSTLVDVVLTVNTEKAFGAMTRV
jgi:hypothetical protein